ncbi:MAG: ABC transporter permease [Anaerolineae bacterium]
MSTSEVVLLRQKEDTFGQRFLESELWAVLKRLLRNPKGAFGTGVLALLVAMAVLGPRIVPYDPIELHLEDKLGPPSAEYWFGTDELGRDIFSRIVSGAAVSLQAGLLAVSLAGVIGALTGLLAGYLGGGIDAVIMRIWDTVLAFPSVFLAIGIVTILGPERINAVIAVAAISMPTFARLVRAQTLCVKAADFVVAARAIGCSDRRIMFRTILPNCITPMVVNMAIAAPGAILVEAALSYLGMGSQPPDPSWGNMLQAAQQYLRRSSTYGVFPGVAITLVVLGMSFFADGLQDALDPRRIHAAAKVA